MSGSGSLIAAQGTFVKAFLASFGERGAAGVDGIGFYEKTGVELGTKSEDIKGRDGVD